MLFLRCGFFLVVCFLLGACVREETTQADSLQVNVHEGYLNHFATPPKTVVHTTSRNKEVSDQILCGVAKVVLFPITIAVWKLHEKQEKEEELKKEREDRVKKFALVFVDPNNHWDRVALRFNPGKTNLPNNDHIRSLCKNPSVQLDFISYTDPILHHSFLWSPPPNLGSIDLHFSQDGFLVVNGERLTPKPSPP